MKNNYRVLKNEFLNGGSILRMAIEGGHSLMAQLTVREGGNGKAGIVIGEGRATFENPIPVVIAENGWAGGLLYGETGPLRQTHLRPPFSEEAGHITFKFALTT